MSLNGAGASRSIQAVVTPRFPKDKMPKLEEVIKGALATCTARTARARGACRDLSLFGEIERVCGATRVCVW